MIPFRSGGAFGLRGAFGDMVDRPSLFPLGLAGEAGPEAIVPLKRGPDGNLGVANFGASPAPVLNSGGLERSLRDLTDEIRKDRQGGRGLFAVRPEDARLNKGQRERQDRSTFDNLRRV